MESAEAVALPRLSLAAVDALPVGSLVACVEFENLDLVGRFVEISENGRVSGEIMVEFEVPGGCEWGFDFWPFEECVALPADCGLRPLAIS